ncbi:roundabout homolog 2-like [Penaeus indicus]|uniref:roundabout homolog 2-like n=1 Tax=Penaeus indicus TaxID=29960 RepID=UPI00300CFD2D
MLCLLYSPVLREEFRTLPQDMSVASGERAEIACSPPRGHPPPDLAWTRNGHPIDLKEEAERVQVREDGTLVIQEVLQTDEGEYVCEASNPAGTRKSPPAILDVIVAPFWVKAPRDVVGVAGKEVEISCRVGGDPPPSITWRKVGGRIPLGRMRVVRDRGLRVLPLRPDDAGVYLCKAANRAAAITANATLTVLSKPHRWPRILLCWLSGRALGQDSWPGLFVRFLTWTLGQDSWPGLSAIALWPEISARTLARALGQRPLFLPKANPALPSASPRVAEVPGDQEVEEGAPLTLSCAVQGFPAPLVYWTREGSQTVLPAARAPLEGSLAGLANADEEEDAHLEAVRMAYHVPRAAHHHSGRYICGGVNSAGGVMTRVAVRVRPAHLLPPPIISVPPANQTLPEGGHAALTCRVWGSPPPTVTWRHRGRLVTATARRKLLQDNTLTIEDLAFGDGGEYACVASSPRGVTEARALLQVASPSAPGVVFLRAPDPDTAPGPPPTPTVRASNGTAAVVTWEPPARGGASPVTGYTLESYSSSEAVWRVAAALTPLTSFTLAPLDPAEAYGVTVRAHNAHGVSEPSGIAEVGGGRGGWAQERAQAKGEGLVGLLESRVTLQDAVLTGPTSAKILWQKEEDKHNSNDSDKRTTLRVPSPAPKKMLRKLGHQRCRAPQESHRLVSSAEPTLYYVLSSPASDPQGWMPGHATGTQCLAQDNASGVPFTVWYSSLRVKPFNHYHYPTNHCHYNSDATISAAPTISSTTPANQNQ